MNTHSVNAEQTANQKASQCEAFLHLQLVKKLWLFKGHALQ